MMPRPCLFGCDCAADDIRHYFVCRRLWHWVALPRSFLPGPLGRLGLGSAAEHAGEWSRETALRGVVLAFHIYHLHKKFFDKHGRVVPFDAASGIRLDAPHRYADFVRRALELRGEQPPPAPEVDLKNTESALRSACEAARLVSLHWEELAPDECAIGRIVESHGKEFSFREVNPSARWNRDLAEHPFKILTRIDFLSGYEEALAEVLHDLPA